MAPVRLAEIRRYPIKSLLGERLTEVEIDGRGLAGDRHHDMTFGVWATVERPGRVGVGDTVEVGPR